MDEKLIEQVATAMVIAANDIHGAFVSWVVAKDMAKAAIKAYEKCCEDVNLAHINQIG